MYTIRRSFDVKGPSFFSYLLFPLIELIIIGGMFFILLGVLKLEIQPLIPIIIVVQILLGIWISKKIIDKNSKQFSFFLMKEEPKIFKKTYGQALNHKTLQLLLIIYGTVAIIGLLFLLATRVILPTANADMIYGVIVVVCLFFYSVVISMFYKGQASDCSSFVNKKEPDTNLIIGKMDISIVASKEMESHGMDFFMSGKYRGRAISFESYLENGVSHINVSLCLKIDKYPGKRFSIKDKTFLWQEIKGDNLDDCFNKRFSLEGIKVQELPTQFKVLSAKFERVLNLDIHDTKIHYEIEIDFDKKVPFPFYSNEGMILFLNSLSQIAESLELS